VLATGGDELAESLMLVRASTLKMIRLQLAMERRDRRVALEEVDDLLALDRRLQHYLGDAPGRGALMRELEEERAALNREKLTLAAEVVRREPVPEPHVEQPAEPVEVEMTDPAVWEDFEFAQTEEPRRHRAIWAIALVLVVLAEIGGATYMFADPATLVAWVGALR
jgi:hypothetical protein